MEPLLDAIIERLGSAGDESATESDGKRQWSPL
jgi:hypothetical protein